MDKLVEVVNKLQDVLGSLGTKYVVDLPQIAVVGGQSAGKSSVLECCVGKDFLPRGSGIVTRRPLILQLINHAGGEYGEFGHKPNIKYSDFNEIRKEIEEETDRVTGKNKNISAIPIRLRVFSPNIVTITLVDLPGLTKIAIGDQPKDIDRQINNMVTEYISNSNCLILAVTPANIDLANSDALLLAKTVDPQVSYTSFGIIGIRTIGVITKIDLMDRGTNCRDTLLNITYPLKRGYVGVVNRSQADIDGNMDLFKAQQAEQAYFLSHDAYRDIAGKCGSRYLQEMLSVQLSNHIKTCLPSIKNNITNELLSYEKEIAKFDFDAKTPETIAQHVMMLVQDFNEEIEKGLGFKTENVETSELSVGAIINRIINERFPYEMAKLKPSANSMRQEIRFAIKNAQGVRTSVFTPDAAFTTVCRKKIEEIRPIALLMLGKIVEELRVVVEQACLSKISKYIKLMDEVKMAVLREMAQLEAKATEQINLILDFETSYINTKHPEFISFIEGSLNKELGDMEDGNMEPIDRETRDMREMRHQPKPNILRKGYLMVQSAGMFKNNRSAFIVVQKEKLFWFKDETERELKYTVDIRKCVCRSNKKNSFQILKQDGSFILKDQKYIEFVTSNDDECDDWKATFMAAGVYPENPTDQHLKATSSGTHLATTTDDMSVDEFVENDPVLYRQVELIRTFIETYTNIVNKTQTDMIGKIVICLVVNKLRTFCQGPLIASVYANEQLDSYLEESEEETRRKNQIMKIYNCLKNATRVINDVITSAPSGQSTEKNYSIGKHFEAEKKFRHMELSAAKDNQRTIPKTNPATLRRLPQRPINHQ